MTPAKEKQARKALNDVADFLNDLVAALRERNIENDPELAALIDEAHAHRDDCLRAATNN